MDDQDRKDSRGHTTEPRRGGQQKDEGNRQQGGRPGDDDVQHGRCCTRKRAKGPGSVQAILTPAASAQG